jgi:hypothetical protein
MFYRNVGCGEHNFNLRPDLVTPESMCMFNRPEGNNIIERIQVPEGFERIKTSGGSFANFLQNLPLKPHGSIRIKQFTVDYILKNGRLL